MNAGLRDRDMQQEQPLLAMNALWVGSAPGPLEILCLLSAAARGHHVRLFGYERFANVPSAIEQADAREILPEEAIVRHSRTGSLALFSDRFRYELIRKSFGAWMDADMLFLKPVRTSNGNLFAWEACKRDYIGSSLLAFDPDSDIVAELCDWAARPAFIKPWLPWHRRMKLAVRSWFVGKPAVADMEWGAIGPDLITHLVRKYGMLGEVSDWQRFYPIPYDRDRVPMMADGKAESYFTEETEAVHLWHQGLLGGLGGQRVPEGYEIPFEKGSLLWRTAREVGMAGELVWRV